LTAPPTDPPLTPGGPWVVALGGGHGLATTLRALRHYAGRITAVVTVADDGGSSGRLRESIGVPAPGDLRRCLEALSDHCGLWGRVFSYRFEAGELEGHALGNLVLAGLAAATGDFAVALEEAARMVGAVGTVLPATAEPVTLKADIAGREVVGQVQLAYSDQGPISSISVVPADASPPAAVLEAIDQADQVVLGPGSLFTSVLAVAVVPGIREALAARSGGRIYVSNLRPQIPETAGFGAADHLAALRRHGVVVDVVVRDPAALPGPIPGVVVDANMARADGLGHDPGLLAAVLAALV
jgi:uncharacterized cofD-like protein